MKYLVTNHKNNEEKEKIQKQGLYCYDLRSYDDRVGIATIEKNVLVNRVGSVITSEEIKFPNKDFIDYDSFELVNENVRSIDEMLSLNEKGITRQLDNNIYLLDLGYRNKQPVALIEKTTKYGKEYIIGFNYQITDNVIDWGYRYYYDKDKNKAMKDFKKVLEGKNLEDTFKEKNDKKNKERERY